MGQIDHSKGLFSINYQKEFRNGVINPDNTFFNRGFAIGIRTVSCREIFKRSWETTAFHLYEKSGKRVALSEVLTLNLDLNIQIYFENTNFGKFQHLLSSTSSNWSIDKLKWWRLYLRKIFFVQRVTVMAYKEDIINYKRYPFFYDTSTVVSSCVETKQQMGQSCKSDLSCDGFHTNGSYCSKHQIFSEITNGTLAISKDKYMNSYKILDDTDCCYEKTACEHMDLLESETNSIKFNISVTDLSMTDNVASTCYWVENRYYDCDPASVGELVTVIEKELHTNFTVCNIEIFGGESKDSAHPNIALGKPVWSSISATEKTTATLTTDNIYRQGFHYDNECWKAGTENFWLIIDLKATYNVKNVHVVRGNSYIATNDVLNISLFYSINPDANLSICAIVPFSNMTLGSTNIFSCSLHTVGRYVEISNGPKTHNLLTTGAFFDICEIFVYGTPNNAQDTLLKQYINVNSFVTQSSTPYPQHAANKAVDIFSFNNIIYTKNISCSQTNERGNNWWGVDFQELVTIQSVSILPEHSKNFENIKIYITNIWPYPSEDWLNNTDYTECLSNDTNHTDALNGEQVTFYCDNNPVGTHLIISGENRTVMICDIAVYGWDLKNVNGVEVPVESLEFTGGTKHKNTSYLVDGEKDSCLTVKNYTHIFILELDHRNNYTRINYFKISTGEDRRFKIYISNDSSSDSGQLCNQKTFVYKPGNLKHSCYRKSVWGRYVIIKDFSGDKGIFGKFCEIRVFSFDLASNRSEPFKFTLLSKKTHLKEKYRYTGQGIESVEQCSAICSLNATCLGFSFPPCYFTSHYPTLTKEIETNDNAFVARSIQISNKKADCL
ncbi:DgyrCDS8755 [Dimorphilus gyrociliatus]|nr:DgyrCDS8755 [Dimorphilus gyrociliatus]